MKRLSILISLSVIPRRLHQAVWVARDLRARGEPVIETANEVRRPLEHRRPEVDGYRGKGALPNVARTTPGVARGLRARGKPVIETANEVRRPLEHRRPEVAGYPAIRSLAARIIYFVALAAMVVPLRAATLDEAHGAFASGKFQISTAAYQAVLDEKGYSAPVLFDLGNSYFREGNYPQAILAYKRALWLAPGDEDILANLQMAQKEAGSIVEEPSRIAKMAGVLSVNGWAWTGCVAWTLLCVSVLLRAVLPGRRTLLAGSGFACVVVLLGAFAAIAVSSSDLHEAVVVDKNAAALRSPFPAAQSVFTPAPGETVKIEKAYNDYLLVADGAGHSGWIAKNQVAPVVPAS
jgi:tetratricopeptide (TPR) repeat protein